MPKVSVIMPVYNQEKYVAAAIQSILAQTCTNFEIILVDDGSTDAIAHIVRSIADSRIRYTYQTNHGQAAALNTGLDLAQGEYVTTLDADDFMPVDSLHDRVVCLDQHSEFGAVYGDGYYCKADAEPFLRFSEYRLANFTGDVYENLIVSSFIGTGATVMIRRQVLEAHQLRYDESIFWCQDWDFYIRVAEHAAFCYVDTNTVHYRLHDTNMTVAAPEGRRRDSLIRTKYKVMQSERFKLVAMPSKRAFFYDLLVKDLDGRLVEQRRIIGSEQFRTLPPRERAKLIRLSMDEYFLRGEQLDSARNLLRQAWALSPWDAKTGLICVLSFLNVQIARRVVSAWRNLRQKERLQSPFEMARRSSQQIV